MPVPQTEADTIIPGPCPVGPINPKPPIVVAIEAAIESKARTAAEFWYENSGDVPRQVRVSRNGATLTVTVEAQ